MNQLSANSNDYELPVIKYKCEHSTLFFTRYFFYKKTQRKFVIGEHHKLICDALDKVLNGEITRLIINIAPRYGKTELAVKNFIAKGLSINPSARFIHLSYSDDLALDNSDEVREMVKSEEFTQLYPDVKIKPNSDSKKKWYTTKNGGVYATSAAGQVTGFGAGQVDEEDFIIENSHKFAGALIIDDPIKPEDGDSEVQRERINQRYDSTIKNRVNSRKTPIIIIMQRIHENDLCGYLINQDPDEWNVLSLPCIKEDGTALWEFKHTIEELKKMQKDNPVVFERQYQQDPKPLKGLLYRPFKTYVTLPTIKIIKSYTDTADKGEDNLCSVIYGVPLNENDNNLYVIDVLYTSEPMEVTEPLLASILLKHRVNLSYIESNNGGRGFARTIKDLTKLEVEDFHQSGNKETRIYSRSAQVNIRIVFPEYWHSQWYNFYNDVTKFKSNYKSNKHDDAPDCLTGIIEKEDVDEQGIIGW